MREEQQTELIFGRNAVIEALKADTPINHILVTSMTGSLGAICLLMLWLYFCTIIFLLGAEINLLLAEKRTGKNG